MITVAATLSRRIQDEIDATVVGYTYTKAELVLDHEARRDVVVQVRGQVLVGNYVQNIGPRTIYTVTGWVE